MTTPLGAVRLTVDWASFAGAELSSESCDVIAKLEKDIVMHVECITKRHCASVLHFTV